MSGIVCVDFVVNLARDAADPNLGSTGVAGIVLAALFGVHEDAS
jgi:hypothetical protein